ncbi:unnamed protein product, partial [Allacma fusca]
NILKKMFTGLARIRKAYLNIRVLQLSVQFFNIEYSYHIFAAKLFCITNCILLIAYGILIFEREYTLTVICKFIGIGYGCLYIVIAENGFRIQVGMKKYRSKILLAAGFLVPQLGRHHVVRSIRSIPAEVGIQVGNFHKLERTSTPNFFYFTLRNIVRILIGFRPKIP